MARPGLPPAPKNDPRVPVEDRLQQLFTWAEQHDLAVRQRIDELERTALRTGRPLPLQSYPKAQLVDGSVKATRPVLVFVPDAGGGGPTPAYADGTDFRRTDTGAIVS